MIDQLLQKEVQDFLVAHEQEDEQKLVLKQRMLFGVPSAIIAEQLVGRRKAKTKLPLYYNTKGIVYPPGLNLEQSSSEKTAYFKADLLRDLLRNKSVLADLTGGFGVDSHFFSKVFGTVHFVEPSASLVPIAQHNHNTLDAANIQYHTSTAEGFLDRFNEKLDCAFLDPSRRSKTNQKVFRLSNCEPNAAKLLPEIFKKCEFVLIKTSPLLDLQQGVQELKSVEKIWVVSVDNECKEVLFFCKRDYTSEPEIIAIDLKSKAEIFSFTFSDEKNAKPNFSTPLHYLYEPNASILKAGAFKKIAEKFSVFKLHPNTHLYTSNDFVQNFPGRIFKVLHLVKADSTELKEIFPEGKANVMTRNYPLSPEELKKKTKLKDGGEFYLIGFSGQNEKHLVAADRIK